ncbi:flagellin [Piscibacillus halophilus]|uniref:flagellin N-terminal helical domain-containing protein n=1 Tax=Piscibacillus halophilus TaxID=571933 RepID=UPI002409C3C0|nr:flagellin [Piscibacillus halophilus]
MIINNNIPALNTHRQMGINQGNMQSSMEKLSSGLRINRAGDDAAGLAISEKMRAQINGLDQASRNAQDGISLIQTAEGALDETHSILQRMRELAVQSANDTNTDADRAELQKEADQLAEELSRIGDNTEFNTQKLLDGSLDNKFHIGANADQNISLSVSDMRAEALGVTGQLTADSYSTDDGFQIDGEEFTGNVLKSGDQVVAVEVGSDFYALDDVEYDSTSTAHAAKTDAEVFELEAGDAYGGIDISSQASADSAITTINEAIESVSAERSKLGAVQNRLEHTISNLDNASENLSAAESRIRDVDMAKEMMEMTKSNILSQASQSMLAQANQQPQSVLQLLG